MKRRKHGKAACPDGATNRAYLLEAEVMHHVDDILSDPERVTRDLDEAIARETAAIRNPAAEFAALATQVA